MLKFKNIILMAFGLLTLPSYAATPNRAFANVMGAASWTDVDTAPYGVYELSMDAPASLTATSTSVVPGNFGAVYVDGKYFVSNGFAYGDITFVTNYLYDADTWQKITDFEGEPYNADDMVWREADGKVYGFFTHLVTLESFFGTIDISTGHIIEISRPHVAMSALGCHADGSLYAISKQGALYSVNPADGSMLLIGETGLQSTYSTSGAVLSREKKFYYVTCSDVETAFYTVDLATAQVEKLYDMPDGEEIRGLFFTGPEAVDKAPGEVTGLHTYFEDDALEGGYAFTLPQTLFDGSEATGEIEWQIFLDKGLVGSGNGFYGQNISGAVAVGSAGMHTLEVRTINAAGNGPVASLRQWFGDDQPSPVANLTLDYLGDGTFELSWSPSGALHGGYFVAGDLTYQVTRYPGEKSLGETASTSLTDVVPLPGEDEYETYYYVVKALYHGQTSSSVISRSYTLGSVTPPFKEEFNNRWDLGKFTIIDANSDWERWNWDSKTVTLLAGNGASDDYLVLPPLLLEEGRKYRFAIDAKAKYTSDTERFEVLLGTGAAVASLTTVIMEPTDVQSTDFSNFSVEFSVSADGTYFIAVHGISAPYQGALTIDNIEVTEVPQSALGVVEAIDMAVMPASGGIYVNSGFAGTFTVADVSGRILHFGKVTDSAFVSCPPGVYIVNLNGRTCKVVVR